MPYMPSVGCQLRKAFSLLSILFFGLFFAFVLPAPVNAVTTDLPPEATEFLEGLPADHLLDVLKAPGPNNKPADASEFSGTVIIGGASADARLEIGKSAIGLLTNVQKEIANSAIVINASSFGKDKYFPGIIWRVGSSYPTTVPWIGIWGQMTQSGSKMFLGTSNSPVKGITNQALTIDQDGKVIIGIADISSLTADIVKGNWQGSQITTDRTAAKDTTPDSWFDIGNSIVVKEKSVGIGASLPKGKLQVVGANSYGVSIGAGTGGGNTIDGTLKEDVNQALFLNASSKANIIMGGNVGIKTNNAENFELNVAGSSFAHRFYLNGQSLTTFVDPVGQTSNHRPTYRISQTIAANDYWEIYGEGYSNTGNMIFETGDDLSEGFIFRQRRTWESGNNYKRVTRDILTIQGDGKVGIGTTAPLAPLDIGGGDGPGNSTNQIAFQWEGAGKGYRHWINTFHSKAAANNKMSFFLNTSGTAGVSSAPGTGNLEVLTLVGNGNVGIGKTEPKYKLDVAGSFFTHSLSLEKQPPATYTDSWGVRANSSPPYSIYQTMADNDYWKIYGEGGSNSGNLVFEVGDDLGEGFIFRQRRTWESGNSKRYTSDVFTIAPNGNVGIGVTNPSVQLEVRRPVDRVGIQIVDNMRGVGPDNQYNGSLSITRYNDAYQYINLIRAGKYPWSIGIVPGAVGKDINVFGIGAGTTMDSSFSPFFAITTSGKVGIGTMSPCNDCKLDVRGGDINVGYFGNDRFVNLPRKEKIAFETDRVGLDVAELFESEEEVEVGDIVAVSDTERRIKKSSTAYDEKIVGVVSGSPALLFEGSELKLGAHPNRFEKGTKPPVALAGRIPVKVSLENGSIKPGDYLTSSSKPGIAMKATEPGMTIGVALEGYNSAGNGAILVFLNLDGRNIGSAIKSLETRLEAIEQKVWR